jgi:hypothetical protein
MIIGIFSNPERPCSARGSSRRALSPSLIKKVPSLF